MNWFVIYCEVNCVLGAGSWWWRWCRTSSSPSLPRWRRTRKPPAPNTFFKTVTHPKASLEEKLRTKNFLNPGNRSCFQCKRDSERGLVYRLCIKFILMTYRTGTGKLIVGVKIMILTWMHTLSCLFVCFFFYTVYGNNNYQLNNICFLSSAKFKND